MIAFMGQLFLAGLFLVSSISKCLDMNEFRMSIKEFGVVDDKRLITIGSYFFVFIEIMSAYLLINMFSHVFSLILPVGMMTLFVIVFIKVILEKKKLKCNCFGKSDKGTNNIYAVIRNLVIIGLIVFCWIYQSDDLLSPLDNFLIFTIVLFISFIICFVKDHYFEKRKEIQNA
ncbi:MauE/DoxX family redox-associated membrane protein [Paenibacillus sp. TSA_86.1]|uniref:MauE/DoxX family redox-associated membrane protein n=1 Tax=Paenibacillus sp. TSA_86.1 TaxID=3415649 RepID=UPI004045EEDC